MSVSKKIRDSIEKASWIRKMFEEGALRKARYGPENVFDFSLGNPNLEPPARFKEVLKELASDNSPGMHRYMSNAGLVETRQAVADYLSNLNNLSFGPEDIVMTVGAAGALNVILKVILNPGDEVIIPAPYFMEYNSYVDNYGGIPKTVATNPDFSLDLFAIEKAMSSNTRAVLINNPNNPTYHYDLAVCLVDRYRYTDGNLIDLEEAIIEYEKAEQLEPGYEFASENVAVLKDIYKNI